MTTKELNPVIKAVAEQYKFDITWSDELSAWMIRNYDSSFYWCSLLSYDGFFDDLENYFYELGRAVEFGSGC
jgi:hypothetical protein